MYPSKATRIGIVLWFAFVILVLFAAPAEAATAPETKQPGAATGQNAAQNKIGAPPMAHSLPNLPGARPGSVCASGSFGAGAIHPAGAHPSNAQAVPPATANGFPLWLVVLVVLLAVAIAVMLVLLVRKRGREDAARRAAAAQTPPGRSAVNREPRGR